MKTVKSILTVSGTAIVLGGVFMGLMIVAFVQAINISGYIVKSPPMASDSVTLRVHDPLKVKDLPFTNTAKLQSTQPASQLYNLSPGFVEATGVELLPVEMLRNRGLECAFGGAIYFNTTEKRIAEFTCE